MKQFGKEPQVLNAREALTLQHYRKKSDYSAFYRASWEDVMKKERVIVERIYPYKQKIIPWNEFFKGWEPLPFDGSMVPKGPWISKTHNQIVQPAFDLDETYGPDDEIAFQELETGARFWGEELQLMTLFEFMSLYSPLGTVIDGELTVGRRVGEALRVIVPGVSEPIEIRVQKLRQGEAKLRVKAPRSCLIMRVKYTGEEKKKIKEGVPVQTVKRPYKAWES